MNQNLTFTLGEPVRSTEKPITQMSSTREKPSTLLNLFALKKSLETMMQNEGSFSNAYNGIETENLDIAHLNSILLY